MQVILDVFDEVSRIIWQSISVKKTEVLIVNKESYEDVDIKINNTSLKKVSSFKYVGSPEKDKVTMDQEIKIRIQRMAISFNCMMTRVGHNKNLYLKVKLIIFEVRLQVV